jgi:hypothetical protein
MPRLSVKLMGSIVLPLFAALLLIGCEPAGPAERAGKNLDEAGQKVKESVDPRGPAQKAGDKIDQAVGNK